MEIRIILIVVCFINGLNCDEKSGIVFPDESIASQNNPANCSAAQSCGDCLKLIGCAWCEKKISNDAEMHSCMNRDDAQRECKDNFIEESPPKFYTIRNDPLSSANSKSKEIIQLQPQHVKVRNIRLGQKANLTVSYKQAKNYPVDIYFLMDLSNSMSDDKEQLTQLSGAIVRKMEQLTSNVTLGFGSFVDKNVQPFVIETHLGAYSFQHHLSMVSDSNRFEESVRSAKIIPTYDYPESGFDALVQAITCSKEIGWRNPSRHIILLATDDSPHMAGDGKLGEAFLPNDGKCHLNNNKRYAFELTRDYPSVGLIRRLVLDNNKNLIVAVTESHVKVYEALFNEAKGVTVAKLNKDSSNIIELLEKQYTSITSSVELTDNAKNEYVKIHYFTQCLQHGGEEKQSNNCTNLSPGSQVDFRISIEVVGYPEKKEDRIQTVVIQPAGLSERLVLEIEILNDCPCELANQVCPNLCSDFEPCVKCHQQKETPVADCLKSLNSLDTCENYTMISQLDPVTVSGVSERMCEIIDEKSDCRTTFVYGYDESGVRRKIRFEAVPTCPSPFPILSVSLSLMGAIIGIGLALLLIWRLLIFLYDRAEYAKFLKESENAKWDAGQNPLYVGASTSFVNPAFQNT